MNSNDFQIRPNWNQNASEKGEKNNKKNYSMEACKDSELSKYKLDVGIRLCPKIWTILFKMCILIKDCPLPHLVKELRSLD